jgi:uncharacterized protein (DUF488 family)
MNEINLFTIGFTKKSAEVFFTKLKSAKIKRIIDIRLTNTSQLAGFAKTEDLKYFLKTICSIEYVHMPLLAPTKEILDEYKKTKGDYNQYVKNFNKLITERKIENIVEKEHLNYACLLCSEDKPQKCHRRLVAKYFKDKFKNIKIIHL